MADNNKDIFNLSQQILKEAECLFTREEVEQALDDLALRIERELHDKRPLILTIMNGGLIPAGMLLPRLHFPLQIDYIHATRYGKHLQPGELNWVARPSISLRQRTLLLIDDIHDEGTTLKCIMDFCYQQGADRVYSCVLTHKKHNRKKSPPADFTGLEVPDRYVFGYGMDYQTLLRNADGIFAVRDK